MSVLCRVKSYFECQWFVKVRTVWNGTVYRQDFMLFCQVTNNSKKKTTNDTTKQKIYVWSLWNIPGTMQWMESWNQLIPIIREDTNNSFTINMRLYWSVCESCLDLIEIDSILLMSVATIAILAKFFVYADVEI